MAKRIVVGITGASGVIYGIRFLKICGDLGIETHLIMSKWGAQNIIEETGSHPSEVAKLAHHCYDFDDLAAPLSSGSFLHDGMIIIPCSMKTLAALSNGYSDNLIVRAGDVTIKERRTLVIVPREAPLNAIHLENMLKLSRLGVVINPLMPAMYAKPKSIEEMIDHSVGRLLDLFQINHDLCRRWGEKP